MRVRSLERGQNVPHPIEKGNSSFEGLADAIAAFFIEY